VRVRVALTMEFHARECAKAVLVHVEVRMLARQDNAWWNSAPDESFSDRCKLDRLGTRPDDERYATIVQAPP
jgi:hypothetical protein